MVEDFEDDDVDGTARFQFRNPNSQLKHKHQESVNSLLDMAVTGSTPRQKNHQSSLTEDSLYSAFTGKHQ